MSSNPDRQRRVEVVAESKRGMIDAMRQALLGATRRMGSLDRCEAEILSQIIKRGHDRHYEITLSVTRRQPATNRGF